VAHTRADREKAEWFWAMLSDHAWNGTDLKNKRHNAELRRNWASGLGQISQRLSSQAWQALGLEADTQHVTVFNPLSFARDVLVACNVSGDVNGVSGAPSSLRVQGNQRTLVFVAPQVPAFGFREFRFERQRPYVTVPPPFSASTNSLEGPFYRLEVDLGNGGLTSLVHAASGQELIVGRPGRSLCQTVFFDGQEQRVSDVDCRARFDGFSGELHVTGHMGDIRVTNNITLYAALDRVDFDLRLEKPPTTNEQRLLHFFPLGDGANHLRIETTAAVLRPRPQPDGDLLPGADTRRFAVQGFVDYAPPGRSGVTLVPLDAFMLRLDQGVLAFEALGNDQNWKEVTQDQDGARHFRFRYSLRAHAPGYDNAGALAWSRSVTAPLALASGRLPEKWLDRPHLEVDPARALATCLKPLDGTTADSVLVRIWETSGTGGPLAVKVPGYRQASETDLLERERGELPVKQGQVSVNARGHGFAAVKLER
jgi:hypothetical protein